MPIPRGWTVHRDFERDELFVMCSDECRIAAGLPQRVPGPTLDDLFAAEGEMPRKSVLEPGPDLDDLF